MSWAYPYKAFCNWNLTVVAVVMAMVISTFNIKASVPPFLPTPQIEIRRPGLTMVPLESLNFVDFIGTTLVTTSMLAI